MYVQGGWMGGMILCVVMSCPLLCKKAEQVCCQKVKMTSIGLESRRNYREKWDWDRPKCNFYSVVNLAACIDYSRYSRTMTLGLTQKECLLLIFAEEV